MRTQDHHGNDVLRGQLELRNNLLGPLEKQGHRRRMLHLLERWPLGKIWEREGRDGHHLLTAHVQGLTCGDQHLEARARLEERHNVRASAHHLLNIVKHQQQLLRLQIPDEKVEDRVLSGGTPECKRTRKGRKHLVRVRYACEADEYHAVFKIVNQTGRYLECEPRFPDATRPREREEPVAMLPQACLENRHLLVSPNE
jgi:hypothetical protein